MRSGWRTERSRRTSALMIVKMAVFAPIPRSERKQRDGREAGIMAQDTNGIADCQSLSMLTVHERVTSRTWS